MRERAAVIIVDKRQDTLHTGWAVLWRDLTPADARRICLDPRTAGQAHFLAWVMEDDLRLWHQVVDDGRYAAVLADLGISVQQEEDGAS